VPTWLLLGAALIGGVVLGWSAGLLRVPKQVSGTAAGAAAAIDPSRPVESQPPAEVDDAPGALGRRVTGSED
jgi:hypothetical protein